LLLRRDAYVSSKTAALYGLDPADYGPELTHVQLDASRPGFLTRVGFLAAFSGLANSGVFFRGPFIARQVQGIDTGNACDKLAPPLPEGVSERQLAESLTAQAECWACHKFLDPAGLVLLQFDAVGKPQSVDFTTGDTIDTAATLYTADAEQVQIADVPSLAQWLAGSPHSHRAYVRFWTRYAYGRIGVYDFAGHDACLIDRLGAEITAGDYPITRLMAGLTQTGHFRMRSQLPSP
jgi:hypothetical protein